MNYSKSIKQLFENLERTDSLEQENLVWEEWLTFKWLNSRTKMFYGDLFELLESDVRNEFKARAIIILLSPDLSTLPFKWVNEEGNKYIPLEIKIELIPVDLLDFTANLVCQNVKYAFNHRKEEVRKTLLEYLPLVYNLLETLPEDHDLGQKLFDCFSTKGSTEHDNHNTRNATWCGYSPYYYIFNSQNNIPLKWKWLADKILRERFVTGQNYSAKSEKKWGEALGEYILHIDLGSTSTDMIELIVSQISFIMSLPNIERYMKFVCLNNDDFINLVKILIENNYRQVCHKLIRLVILDKSKSTTFEVKNAETMEVSNLILKEFGTVDSELVERLTPLINQYLQQETKTEKSRQLEIEKKTALLNKMS